jgi:hypothetical protein
MRSRVDKMRCVLCLEKYWRKGVYYYHHEDRFLGPREVCPLNHLCWNANAVAATHKKGEQWPITTGYIHDLLAGAPKDTYRWLRRILAEVHRKARRDAPSDLRVAEHS